MGWFYRIAKRYTETPETKKICKHTRKEHLTPDSGGVLQSTHTCYKATGRKKRHYFYAIVEFYPNVAKRGKHGWTLDNIAPMGDTKKDLIGTLTMMLKDAKRYKVLNDTKKAWVKERYL